MNAWCDSALCCQPAFLWMASRLRDKDKRPGNEGKWGFYHPFPSHTVVGPHSPDCLYERGVCVFLHCQVNQMCISLPRQAGLWWYADPRVQFTEITHSAVVSQRNGQSVKQLYVTCARVYTHKERIYPTENGDFFENEDSWAGPFNYKLV